MVRFHELPAEIQERMLQEQERQGNPRNAVVFEVNAAAPKNEGGFLWKQSVEGRSFWDNIIMHSDFSAFYGRYPATVTNSNN